MIAATISRLAREFTVRDIMVPSEQLLSVASEDDASAVFEAHTEFDVVPIRVGPSIPISHYVECGSIEKKPIMVGQDVIGDGTSILDLVGLLESRKFSFVLVGGSISGYVHFSDLNHRLVEVVFYLMLQAVENHHATLIHHLTTPECLPAALGQNRAHAICGRFNKWQRERADLDLMTLLSLEDILKIARAECGLEVTDSLLSDIGEVRDAVSHAWKPLVAQHADVARLVRVRDACLAMPAQMARRPASKQTRIANQDYAA